jgi:hypothetical protein
MKKQKCRKNVKDLLEAMYNRPLHGVIQFRASYMEGIRVIQIAEFCDIVTSEEGECLRSWVYGLTREMAFGRESDKPFVVPSEPREGVVEYMEPMPTIPLT